MEINVVTLHKFDETMPQQMLSKQKAVFCKRRVCNYFLDGQCMFAQVTEALYGIEGPHV